ncbi:MAG: 2-C-methyl-D-erythritol 2,4-cyclodiphosphate synthase [Verrucomicrobia bacterium]|nr:2-C-methyl-D-erythritol 2,4-cyclodiphosphate synthase [Verrucomicrobiota bacterium]
MRTIVRNGIGFDSHRFAAGRKLVLGGVTIEHEAGLEGHSDADVLTHAVIDALFGAVADGDIGRHFPDTDPAWKDASSIKMLASTVSRIEAMRARIISVDSTVIAEAPKIAPYVDKIRRTLAMTLALPPERVSVKAKTAEKMGAIGRQEGMAVMAIATVEQHEG